MRPLSSLCVRAESALPTFEMVPRHTTDDSWTVVPQHYSHSPTLASTPSSTHHQPPSVTHHGRPCPRRLARRARAGPGAGTVVREAGRRLVGVRSWRPRVVAAVDPQPPRALCARCAPPLTPRPRAAGAGAGAGRGRAVKTAQGAWRRVADPGLVATCHPPFLSLAAPCTRAAPSRPARRPGRPRARRPPREGRGCG